MAKAFTIYNCPTNARILAGPGTGKTENLMKKVIRLLEKGTSPDSILALTFTRAAAAELRNRVQESEILNSEQIPIIMNLHAFALRILMSDRYRSKLILPLVILDDWEEVHFLIPSLMYILRQTGKSGKNSILEKLSYYQAGWNKLAFGDSDWTRVEDQSFNEALVFLKRAFGFNLRGELNYILKAYFDSEPIARDELGIKYVLVDEYQDLNPCEQEIIKHFMFAGARIFCFGDDDQSIYRFRQAAPVGLLEFPKFFDPCHDFNLNICYRCCQNLLDIANKLIGNTNVPREKKDIRSNKTTDCNIKCIQFPDGNSELYGIYILIDLLKNKYNVDYRDILILVQSRRYGKACAKTLMDKHVPLEDWLSIANPLSSTNLRKFYSLLRLLFVPKDSLAVWSWLYNYNGLGENTLFRLLHLARNEGKNIIEATESREECVEYLTKRDISIINKAIHDLETKTGKIQECKNDINKLIQVLQGGQLMPFSDDEYNFIRNIIDDTSEESENAILHLLESFRNFRLEPCLIPEENKVRIMTMHKAKGLSSRAVIIPFQEDQVIFSKTTSTEDSEEKRRLFYVSITRAIDFLFITHARTRMDTFAYTRDGISFTRKRSRFLDDMELKSFNGSSLIKAYAERAKKT